YGFGPAPRRLIAQLRIDYGDGESQWVTTNDQWRTTTSSILASDIYGGETRDARLERDGWDEAGFDDKDWRQVSIGAAPAARPRPPRTSPRPTPPAAARQTYSARTFGKRGKAWPLRVRFRSELRWLGAAARERPERYSDYTPLCRAASWGWHGGSIQLAPCG